MHLSFLGTILFYFYNLFFNIMDFILDWSVQPGYGSVMRIFYTVFHMCMAFPLALGVFSKGFRALAGLDAEFRWYRYGEIGFALFGVFTFFSNMTCYHGLRYVLTLRTISWTLFIMGIVEECIILTLIVLRTTCILFVQFKFNPTDPQKATK